MHKINRYWNSDPDSLVEREPPQTYDLCKCCELVNQLVRKEKSLNRALWLARADRAKEKQIHFALFHNYSIDSYLCINGSSMPTERNTTMRLLSEWSMIWENVERKLRAKAEEYK